MRQEPCLCGGWISALSLEESRPYVEAHNLGSQHRAWRALSEYVRLGPCRCQGCDRLVFWSGVGRFGSWANRDGTPHQCGRMMSATGRRRRSQSSAPDRCTQ